VAGHGGVDEDAVAARADEQGDVFVGELEAGAVRVAVPQVNGLTTLVEIGELLAEAVEMLVGEEHEVGAHATLAPEAGGLALVVATGVDVVRVFLGKHIALGVQQRDAPRLPLHTHGQRSPGDGEEGVGVVGVNVRVHLRPAGVAREGELGRRGGVDGGQPVAHDGWAPKGDGGVCLAAAPIGLPSSDAEGCAAGGGFYPSVVHCGAFLA